jgi:hypothetical protein
MNNACRIFRRQGLVAFLKPYQSEFCHHRLFIIKCKLFVPLNYWLVALHNIFFYNPSLFAICTKYNKQMGRDRNKRGGRELSSAHPYGGGARPGMVTGKSTHILRHRLHKYTRRWRHLSCYIIPYACAEWNWSLQKPDNYEITSQHNLWRILDNFKMLWENILRIDANFSFLVVNIRFKALRIINLWSLPWGEQSGRQTWITQHCEYFCTTCGGNRKIYLFVLQWGIHISLL